MDVRRNQFLVDTGDGFNLHNLDSGHFVRAFRTPAAPPAVDGRLPVMKKLPLQVVFGESGKVVVGSSNHGMVYIFEKDTGEVIDRLPHASHGLVQTVTVSTATLASRHWS